MDCVLEKKIRKREKTTTKNKTKQNKTKKKMNILYNAGFGQILYNGAWWYLFFWNNVNASSTIIRKDFALKLSILHLFNISTVINPIFDNIKNDINLRHFKNQFYIVVNYKIDILYKHLYLVIS